jgi:hypothetical protein
LCFFFLGAAIAGAFGRSLWQREARVRSWMPAVGILALVCKRSAKLAVNFADANGVARHPLRVYLYDLGSAGYRIAGIERRED